MPNLNLQDAPWCASCIPFSAITAENGWNLRLCCKFQKFSHLVRKLARMRLGCILVDVFAIACSLLKELFFFLIKKNKGDNHLFNFSAGCALGRILAAYFRQQRVATRCCWQKVSLPVLVIVAKLTKHARMRLGAHPAGQFWRPSPKNWPDY